MDNLLQNRLFLQYLSGAGGAMSQGEPIAPTLNAITQQNIGAQSKAKLNDYCIKMMRDALKGGGAIKLGKDKTTIDLPSSMYGGLGSELAKPSDYRMDMYPQGSGAGKIAQGLRDEGAVEGIAGGLQDEAYGPQFEQMSTDRTKSVNPSASPLGDLSGADLAGLTAADVSQALSGATGVEALRQKKLTDVADTMYKQSLMAESAARAKKLGEPNRLDEPFVGGLTLRQYTALTPKSKEYELAKEGARLLGDKEFMSQREWEMLDPTEREKFVRSAMKDPALMEAAKDLAKSGATRISLGEKVQTAEAMGKVKGKLWYTDPNGLPAAVEKFKSSDNYLDKVARSENPERYSIQAVADYIESRLKEGGTVEDVRMEGRTRVWTVKWPDGSIKEIRHAF